MVADRAGEPGTAGRPAARKGLDNRALTLEEGLWVTAPAELFRDPARVPRAVLDGLRARLQADERALGPAAIRALRWSPTPAGVPWQQLRPDQRQILTALLDTYLGRLPGRDAGFRYRAGHGLQLLEEDLA